MAYKEVEFPDIGKVRIYKHRAARALKIAITNSGYVRVTIPPWAPYRIGLEFAKARRDWVNQHQPAEAVLIDGQQIGQEHFLRFYAGDSLKSSLRNQEIRVYLPPETHASDKAAQMAAKSAVTKALRKEATAFLPARLAELSAEHGFYYSGVNVRILKSRWGSCSHQKHITLNIYLMLVPQELIDYVLLHELVHTRVLHHGPKFWATMEQYLPHARTYAKRLKHFQPSL